MKPAFEPPHSRKAPCPCGSGRKYKHCHGAHPKPWLRLNRRWLGWAVGAAVVAVVGGAILSQRSDDLLPASGGRLGFPLFGDGGGGFGGTGYASIDGVDMSGLSEEERAKVIRTANAQRCTCGCRMTLVQCINTDRTCPLRARNFRRARQLVARAGGSGSTR